MQTDYKFLDSKGEHLHTLRGRPLIGNSSVLQSIKSIPGWYASGFAVQTLGIPDYKILGKIKKKQATEAEIEALRASVAVKLAEIQEMSTEDFITLLDTAYRAHDQNKTKKAKIGTDRHALLETYVKSCIETNSGIPLAHSVNEDISVSKFVDFALAKIEKFLWSEIHAFNEELWIGGIADVGWLGKNQKIVAGDFKSSPIAYFDQWLQIGGYDLEISHSGGLTADGERIFTLPDPIQEYCVIPFGSEDLTPEFRSDLKDLKEGFKAALQIHRLKEINNNN